MLYSEALSFVINPFILLGIRIIILKIFYQDLGVYAQFIHSLLEPIVLFFQFPYAFSFANFHTSKLVHPTIAELFAFTRLETKFSPFCDFSVRIICPSIACFFKSLHRF